MKAACFTVAALDYFPQLDQHFAGGNALNQAVRYRQMGIESAFIGGSAEMANDLAQIAQTDSSSIVLTLGAEGSIAFENHIVFTQPALPLEKVVDATGCGDAFQAAFTASYVNSHDVETALLAGAEWGRQAAMAFGGVPWK